MYLMDGVLGLLGQQVTGKRSYIYARVSSAKQKGDLDRQIQDLQEAYPGHVVIRDIASGVNFKRKGLQTILEHVLSGLVNEVVVMHRDRLARIGADLLEFIFSKVGTKLVVHGTNADAEDKHDLADDLLAVTTLFVASYNGRRAAENRKRRKEEGKTNKRKRTTNEASEVVEGEEEERRDE